MSQVLSRRGLVAAAPAVVVTASLPAFAAGAHPDAALLALAAAAVSPQLGSMAAEVDAAALRCRGAHQSLAAALDAYENALPRPHFTLDMTDRRRWPFTATVERRLFDGKVPKRVINPYGIPAERYVATMETIEQDLRRCEAGDRTRRRLLYRMRRRAKARAAKIEALEASFDLEHRQAEVDAAERQLEDATQAVFAAPAATFAEVMAQARALSAYASGIEAQHATYQAGRYGKVLADGLTRFAA